MPCSKCLVPSGALWSRDLATPRRRCLPLMRQQRRCLIRNVEEARLDSVAPGKMQGNLPVPINCSRIPLRDRLPALPSLDFCNVENFRGMVIPGLAVFGGVIAIHALAGQAWAGSSIADSASFLGSDIDDIQSGFTLAFLLIFFSELGDKTFFIAAILASRKSNVAVFTGTFGALVAMTLISVVLGRAFHYIDGVLPFSLGSNEIPVDDLAAVALLVYFGVSTLLDAASMEASKSQEEQQEAELAVAGVGGGSGSMNNVVLATFALVFVAEWGDKSFFSTIALAAASSPVGVVAGAVAGHGAATLLAVLGGSIMGNYISEKTIAYIGGTLFLVFAGQTLFEILSGSK